MEELRQFAADRAAEAGDREKYMTLQLDLTTNSLTLEKYEAFKKMCTATEWTQFEPKVKMRIKAAWRNEQLKIHMFRKEYPEVLTILTEERYPISGWDDGEEIRTAKRLSRRDTQILSFRAR
jgi:hypothetical protein